MHASLQALLSGLIDYAGLFPPARLSMPDALKLYHEHRYGDHAWMLGRFVCPAARLGELGASHIPCSALARGGADIDEFLSGLDADLADIAQASARVDVLEAKIPPPALRDDASLERFLVAAASRLVRVRVKVFFEAAVADQEVLTRVISHLGQLSSLPAAGFKLRAGGLEASAFPSSKQIASALHLCATYRVPFKATAGLHHPLPRLDSSLAVRMHGFVNLFSAGVLLHAHSLEIDQVVELLDDDDPAHFAFTDAGLRWREVEVTTAEIETTRTQAVLSFGSCSFDEPCDDLHALGWLGEQP